ncbi:MAG: RidA family protein [Microvirga sp.]|jgi:enamine deaminase RidA (YjgF/YER057c/UK114 family)|nr:RidA family protein [Microvirga sp.]
MIVFRNPSTVAPPIGRYTHSVEIPPNARLLIISGQVGMAADGTLADSYLGQWRYALQNLVLNLDAAGMKATDVVKCTTLIVERFRPTRDEERAKTAEIFQEFFGSHLPTWTTHIVRHSSDRV